MRGQGSLEYLLILAAILAIAVVVVLVASNMLAAPTEQADIQQDKYVASLNGVEFPDYTIFYDGSEETAPTTMNYNGQEYIIHHVFADDPILDGTIQVAEIGADENGEPFPIYVEPDVPPYEAYVVGTGTNIISSYGFPDVSDLAGPNAEQIDLDVGDTSGRKAIISACSELTAGEYVEVKVSYQIEHIGGEQIELFPGDGCHNFEWNIPDETTNMQTNYITFGTQAGTVVTFTNIKLTIVKG